MLSNLRTRASGRFCRRPGSLALLVMLAVLVILVMHLYVMLSRVPDLRSRRCIKQMTDLGRTEAVGDARKQFLGRLNSEVFRQRQEVLLSACSALDWQEYKGNDSENTVRKHFVVDRRNKLLFCGIEKIGCTFWKRLLQITSGLRPEKNPYDISASEAHDNTLETFAGLPFYEIMQLAASYKKVLFVRNPYSRIFSGYVDKVFFPNTFYFVLRVKIANLFPAKDTGTRVGCAPTITFNQFLKFALHSLKTNTLRDGHFVPMYDHCKPCQMKYNIIGKMESFAADAKYIITSQNLSHVVDVDFKDDSTDSDTITDKTRHLYAHKKEIEKCMSFSIAMKLFWRSFQIRGIIDKDHELPVKFISNGSLGVSDMIESLLHVNRMSDSRKRRANRQEALLEAYREVSAEDLSEFRRLFKPDFDVFGYNTELNDMPVSSDSKNGFSYLNVQ